MKFKEGLVSITIVNWNSNEYIIDCLKSVMLQNYRNIEIIIIDNNSKDGSLEKIRNFATQNSLNIKIIKNKENVGFSRAHNKAIRISRGEYILPLNFDVCISEAFVENMIKEMESNTKIGFASGKLLSAIKKEEELVLDTTGVELINLFCSDRGQGELDRGQFNKPEYIFGASGCAPFYRRSMLEDIKLNGEYFDETFNTYVEDVDLSWRAQIRGWKCLYNPSAVGIHHRGVTRKGTNGNQIYKGYFIYGFRNRYLMILKNLTLFTFIRKFIFLMKGELKFWAVALLTNRNFYLKFITGFLYCFPILLIKRYHVITSNRVKSKELESLLNWSL